MHQSLVVSYSQFLADKLLFQLHDVPHDWALLNETLYTIDVPYQMYVIYTALHLLDFVALKPDRSASAGRVYADNAY